MASDPPSVGPGEIETLAALAGLTIPREDLEPLAEALEAQLAFAADLGALADRAPRSSMTFDPRWRA